MKEKFNFFGSKNSIDLDVMVFVDKIPSIKESKKLCEFYDNFLSKIYFNIEVNSNLAELKNGIITEVYKGTPDECNNSIFYTYKNHPQKYNLLIKNPIERNIDLKIIRTARVILSFLSRTSYRTEVKYALKSDFKTKLNILNQINLENITDLGTRNIDFIDYLKTLSFQLGQTLELMNGNEIYTKDDISYFYPLLKPMLNRTGDFNLKYLNDLKNLFVLKSMNKLPQMVCLVEQFKN